MPDALASFPSKGVGDVLLAAVDLAAALAPVPWLHPAAQLVGRIVLLCQNVPKNKHAAGQLCKRCQGLLLDIKTRNDCADPERIQLVRSRLEQSLERIVQKMERWDKMNAFERFIRQGEIAQDIRDSHLEIDEVIQGLQLALAQEMVSWEVDYATQCQRDKEELMEYFKNWQQSNDLKLSEILDYLGDLKNKSELESHARLKQDASVDGLKQMMQEIIKLLGRDSADIRRKFVRRNLVAVSRASGGMLPDSDISGDVINTEIYHCGSKMYDIYIGMYMEEEKCALKVLRTIETDSKIRDRLQREEKIWRTLYAKDKGEYIVPFYGVCFDLGRSPVMVSKWMKNGDAVDYIRLRRSVDWKRFIRRIAEGIRILHEFDPPIIHGLIRGSNILIKEFGDPVLSDFCLSKIMHDITGAPVSDIQGLPESYKWLAPEVLFGDGTISTRSDIYSFSMTVYELISGDNPFPGIKRTPEFLRLLHSDNIRPAPLSEICLRDRGLDNSLWDLLCDCWAKDPFKRPTIHQVLARLPDVPPVPW